jgi:hypothetical protein
MLDHQQPLVYRGLLEVTQRFPGPETAELVGGSHQLQRR